ncbi:hypothetical protein BD289DRAFT_438561 [Coniella lustricola]|uniref:P-loop containing nucleoside triphosphate hydrolase protein n=1 Tax=Coniella lustricola TaxID=2025994 RepID=A0A2T3A2Q9_9PEZI|nr:hypothetical protein BD289DRAFT_438561 [Coniella lustricola]
MKTRIQLLTMSSLKSSDQITSDQHSRSKMRIIGLGLPRCATTSLQAAFESPILGCGPCMHMNVIVPQPGKTQLVIDAMREKNDISRHAILYRLFDGFGSTFDVPGSLFADDLMDMYPEAILLLNARPGPEVQRASSWARSCHDAFAFPHSIFYKILCFPLSMHRKASTMLRSIYPYYAEQPRFAGLGLRPGAGSGLDWATPEFYENYQCWVREQAQKRGRKVVEYHPKMGWEPLCELVGSTNVPPPGTPLPHENDAKVKRNRMRMVFASGVLSWIAILVSAWVLFTHAPRLLTHVRLYYSLARQ